MSYTLFDASILVAKDALTSMAGILKKVEQQLNAASLPTAQLFNNKQPLTIQVHGITDTAQKLLARLSGSEPLTLGKDLATSTDMYARINQVEQLLDNADKDLINSRSDRLVALRRGKRKTTHIPGYGYVHAYAIPTIFFHLSSAYNIMRKEGVPLDTIDYLGSFGIRYIQDLEMELIN